MSRFQKLSGRWMLVTLMASLNKGAIISDVNPAMPQPIGVTRKISSG